MTMNDVSIDRLVWIKDRNLRTLINTSLFVLSMSGGLAQYHIAGCWSRHRLSDRMEFLRVLLPANNADWPRLAYQQRNKHLS